MFKPLAIITLLATTGALVAPHAAGARQAISEGPPAKMPPLSIMKHFAGTWSCTSAPGNESYQDVASMNASGDTFTIQSPGIRSDFTSAGVTLHLSRTSAKGRPAEYAFYGYVPHSIDLTFQSAVPSERGGMTAQNTFTPTFEIKRYSNKFVITKKSPKFGTITETCKPV